jgi:hypothetical protein
MAPILAFAKNSGALIFTAFQFFSGARLLPSFLRASFFEQR